MKLIHVVDCGPLKEVSDVRYSAYCVELGSRNVTKGIKVELGENSADEVDGCLCLVSSSTSWSSRMYLGHTSVPKPAVNDRYWPTIEAPFL